ncbi:MAG TPA: hypothetical protein VF940_21430 [Streptosporangiaceae bacterium]
MSGQAAVASNGQIVMADGESGGRPLRSVTRLTPCTGQVQPASALPTPETDAAASFVHGRLTVFGGTNRRSITTVQTPGQRGQTARLARLPQAPRQWASRNPRG